MPRKVIIDCDPGQDDAVALFLAMASPEELEILGVTTVAGNVPLALTQRNARMICDIAERRCRPDYGRVHSRCHGYRRHRGF
jgi:purine nucleosidase